MKFVADDGTIFDTLGECQEYEKNSTATYVKELIQKYITLYDSFGREWTLIDTPTYLNNFSDAFCRDACYIKVNSLIDDEYSVVRDYLLNEYGIELPSYSGIWRYDDFDNEWRRLSDEIDEFTYHWKNLLKNITITYNKQ